MTFWLQFLFLSAAWGGSFLFMRQAAPAFGPLALIALRVGSASLFLAPLAWPQRAKLAKHWKDVLLLGLINSAIPFTLLAWSLKILPAGHGSILNALAPLWVALVGQLFFRQPQTQRVWIGILLAFLGVIVTLEPWHSGVLPQLLPTLAAIAATLCYGFGVHLARRLDKLPAASVAWATMAGAFVWMLIPAILFWPKVSPPNHAWISALALGAISTAAAYIIYYRLLQAYGPLSSVLVTYVVPFFAMLWGWMILGEPAKAGWWWGLALVLMGLGMARRKVQKHRT